MSERAQTSPSHEDRRLLARMRLAMLASLLLSAAVFAGSAVALSLLVATYDRNTVVAVGLERARALGDKLGQDAVAAQRLTSPAHQLLARTKLASLHRSFRDSTDTALEQLGTRAGGAATGGSAAAELRPLVGKVDALMAELTADPGSSQARRAARRLRHLTKRQLHQGFEELIEQERARANWLTQRIRLGGAAVALAALLLFAAQWRWSCRPVLAAIEGRTRALLAANARVERTLLFDALTNLPNRRNLQETLDRLPQGSPLGLLHIDLAGFHAINTTLGLETGNQLLRYVAEVLGELAISSDVVARVDTDEFVLATTRRTDPEQLQDLAVEVIERLAQPVEIDGHAVSLDAVIGIAARSSQAEASEKLIANADIARARAREEGGSVYFSVGMRERLAARRQTAQDLLQALVRDEIVPYFQPQIDASTGRLTGFEALVRWRHPDRGVLNPHFFLDIADQAHLGHRIAGIMIKKSIAALAEWRAAGLEVPRIGLNFNARELRSPGLRDLLAFDLDRSGLTSQDLAVEVLESALIEDEDDPILSNITALAEAGHHIDLDDFGTGHSALSHLRHLRVDRLKIDRSFVRDLHLRPELRKMTQAMIQLAKTLGIEALAEGIETENELRLLVEMGCDDLQGFAIGKPMPAADVPAWIAEHDRRRSAGRVIAAA